MDRRERNEYARRWYAAHKDQICAKARLCIKTDEQKEIHNKASRKYIDKNREKHNLLTKLYKEKTRRNKGIKKRTKTEKPPKQCKIKFPPNVRSKLTSLQKEENKIKAYQKKKINTAIRYKANKADPIKKEYINRTYRERIARKCKSDPVFKLQRQIPVLLRVSIKRQGYSKKSKTFSILGCTWEELKYHLGSKFEPWMNWGNWGKYNGMQGYGWDVDHIIPVSFGKTEFEIIRLNHFTNLQPLDSYINRHIKRNKVA
jgi:hypothetical protein